MDFKSYTDKVSQLYAEMNENSTHILSEPSDDDLIMMYIGYLAFERLLIEQYRKNN